MMIEEVTYDFVAKTLTIGWDNGDRKTYTAQDVAQFLADTGREDDVKTIGWAVPETQPEQ